MEAIPSTVSLTTYDGGTSEFMMMPLAELTQLVESGTLRVNPGKIFKLDEIVEAHRCMEENRAGGKIVVLI
jgi:NADPH:quinone reductase-like Zn-dependent oxidoreductase